MAIAQKTSLTKRVLTILGVLIAGFLAVWGIAAGTRKSSPLSGDVANDPALVERGAYLAVAGDCVACHTRVGGRPFAGGLAMDIPMLGRIFSPNITPDTVNGIGQYSLNDFDRAVRFGIRKDGSNLYPAMPYVSYAKITDDDVRALYTYFKHGVQPVGAPNVPSAIRWPLNIRWPVQVWNDLTVDTRPYQPVAGQSEAWNRGAYLVQGLAHCGTCHTPRGLMMQEKALDQKNGKGFLGGGVVLAGWQAYNITSNPDLGIGRWSQVQVEQYLSTGNVPGLAQAAGGMGEAVTHSFSKMTPQDISAIALYVKSLPAYGGSGPVRSALGRPINSLDAVRGKAIPAVADPKQSQVDAAQLFMGACAACHNVDGSGNFGGYYPSLFRNSTVGAPDANNLVQVILNGLNRTVKGVPVSMPAFGDQLDDAQIAALVNFLTSKFGDPKATVTAGDVRKARGPAQTVHHNRHGGPRPADH